MPGPLPARHPAPRTARGFTIIEILVTMALLGILGTIAVPAFNNAILGNKLASFSNAFMASLQLARSEAIKRNAPVKVCRSADGTTCAGSGGWHQGWIVFNDTDNSDSVTGTEVRMQYQQALPSEFQFSGGTYSFTYLGTGLPSVTSAQSFIVCRKSPLGAQERLLTLSTTGRVGVTSTATGTCS